MQQVPHRARPVIMWCWTLMLLARICDDLDMPPGKYRDIAMECVAARNGISYVFAQFLYLADFSRIESFFHICTYMRMVSNIFE